MKAVAVCFVVLSMLGIGAYAQVNINLGAADNFALLGASGITNVSRETYIIGDVGSYPTCTVSGLTQSQVKGDLFLDCNSLTEQAQQDLTTAYSEAAGATCDTDLSGKNLGGMRLGPGVYCFSSSAQLTGTLTLDAQGNPASQWVFQIGSTLTTSPNSKVVMLLGHGALPLWKSGERGCNVYWQVASSATIGTGNNFVGKILALSDIKLNGRIFRGKALTSNGGIAISHHQRVNGPACNGTD